MTFFSDVTFLEYHMVYLNNQYSLCDLFDQITVAPPFVFPEKTVSVNLENITFGPNERVIAIPDKDHLLPRIIYYSLLHYIFEMESDPNGTSVYEKLLTYIFNHDISLSSSTYTITNEEAKTYFIQFCYSLYRQRYKNKIVVEELSAIPQMDILFRHLLSQLTGLEEHKFNAFSEVVEDKLRKELGFSIEFMNSSLMVFQDQWVVEVKDFEETAEFTIRKMTEEDAKAMKEESGLGLTAYFCSQNPIVDDLCQSKDIQSNVRGTIKSIGLDEVSSKDIQPSTSNKSHPFQEDIAMGMRSFGSVPVTKQILQTSKESSTKMIEEFDKLINSSKYYNDNVALLGMRDQNLTQEKQPLKNQELFPTIRNIKSISLYNQDSDKKSRPPSHYRESNRKDHKYASTMIFNGAYVFESKKLSLLEKTKCLKSQRLKQDQLPSRQEKRVPSFVMDREKAKKSKGRQTVQILGFSSKNKENNSNLPKEPKITFSYRKT